MINYNIIMIIYIKLYDDHDYIKPLYTCLTLFTISKKIIDRT